MMPRMGSKGGSGGRQPPGGAGGPPGEELLEQRRVRRQSQLQVMSNQAFIAEVRQCQASTWPPSRLLEHTKKHTRDFMELFGRPLPPGEVGQMSQTILQNWARLFTNLERNGEVSYLFLGSVEAGRVMIVVVTRDGRIRSLHPVGDIVMWLARHPELVEVTDRARQSGI